MYDIVIVGSGPSALAFAQSCSSLKKKILIVERESVIGGCHRVRRVSFNGQKLFTEHGPRVYSSNYKTFIHLLQDLESSFYDLFTPYNFTISNIGNQTIWSTLNFYELIHLALAFLIMMINSNYGKDISIGEFARANGFKSGSLDIMDRICRLTDGATADHYTLFKFLQLFNQHMFYKLYQPKIPNDIGLFKIWKEKLESRGVEFLLNTTVKSLHKTETPTESPLDVDYLLTTDGKRIQGKKFVIATPPVNLVDILSASPDLSVQNCFGDLSSLKTWANQTRYIDYISVTFHWDTELSLDKIWGFPKSEWGIAFVVLSDYMTFQETVSKTVISAAITITDAKSLRLNKFINECTEDDLIDEILYQMRKSFPKLPKPTASLLSPGVVYRDKRWVSLDTAFISTTNQPFLNSSGKINVFNLGIQNGHSLYDFTSMEAAVSNGVALSHLLYPELQRHYQVQRGIYFTDITFVLAILLIVYFYTRKNNIFNE